MRLISITNKYAILGIQVGGAALAFIAYFTTHSADWVLAGSAVHFFGDFLFIKKNGL